MSVNVVKKSGEKSDDLENLIAKELSHLAKGNSDVASKLKGLYFLAAKEIPVNNKKKAVAIFIPYKLLSRFNRIKNDVIHELEMKFSGRQVVIIAQRTILSPSFTRKTGVKAGSVRPYSRTLKAVHEALLEDIVYPVNVAGKRIRYKTDGTKTLKVLLNANSKEKVEDRLDTFAAVYSKLTNKNVVFLFESHD